MENANHKFNGEPLAAEHREKLLAFVKATGERQAMARIGVSRQAMTRAMSGLGVYPSTRDAILRALGE
jgi:hypothetical protein